MMTHAAIVPVLLPFAVAILMVLLGDRRLGAQRALGVLSCGTLLLIAGRAVARTASGAIEVYQVGDWPAPFGIALVLDRLAALMLALTAVVAVASLAAALTARPAEDTRGRHFHALFQLQLMGLNGAFLTGDLFNLFVFFEVLLIASYCLLVHGRGAGRLRAGFHYVVVNLAASTLFLIAVALLYGLTGTLNLADLARRVSQVAEGDLPLVRAGAVVLLVVFAVKAAVFPLSLWLPRAYAAAPPPVAALFAVMTKVGIYAIIRVHGFVFGLPADRTALAAAPWVLGGAVATAVVGALGALAAKSLGTLTAYLALVSVGTVLIAVSLPSEAGLSAALYYLVHSKLVLAALFLLGDATAAQRGHDRLERSTPVAQPAMLGALFVASAVSVAGLPPLSGFVGKLAILQATAAIPAASVLWTVLLGTGWVAMIALARAGSAVFWRTTPGPAPPTPAGLARLAPVIALLVGGAALALFAAPILRFTDAAVEQLRDRRAYVSKGLREADWPTIRPFPPERRP
jgi:multicomponent K+:H+ antiporter subunit D